VRKEQAVLDLGTSRWGLERTVALGPRYLEAIERCIADMAAAVGGDGCLAVQLAVAAPRPVVTAFIRAGESVGLEFPQRAVVGRDVKPMRSWEPDLPDRYERSHTVTFRYRKRPAHPQDQYVLAHDLLPRGIHDHARRLLYDGRRFLGGVSVERAIDRPLFEPPDLARLDAVANAHIPKLAAAVALDSELAGHTCAMLFDPLGHCEHSSASAARWATPAHRRALSEAVRQLDIAGETRAALFVGETVARIVRVSREGQSRYVVTLRPTVFPLMHPAADLSARQRRIARYAAGGVTIAEIADALGLSPNTVREHLRRAYRVLGVHNRVELNRALDGLPGDDP
jgi:DNA-binding CsgD family transcriptional regulator